jgi:deoxyribose-phosphate aldolase
VKLAKEALKGSDVLVSTVVGFPHGSSVTSIKVAEAQQAMEDGAVELDMVINIGQLRSGNLDYVLEDIKAVCDAAHARGVKVKVIFENSYLTNEEKITACKLSEAAGADWVKTSTGFASGGATLDDLRLMRANVSEHVQVKAAGGVRTLPALLDVIDAGVTRCGATATATILDDFKQMKERDS